MGIRARYTITDFETVESDKDGVTGHYLNNVVGIIEDGYVLRLWGTSRDISAQREMEKGLQQSKDFNQAVLQSLPDHIAVLDCHGTIFTVNENWLRFARDNDLASLERIGPGVNYLDVCRRASNANDDTASSALKGIASVIDGRCERFELEYSCHSPGEQRWFLMLVVPFKGRKGGVIVSHKNITAQKHAEARLIQAEHKYLDVLQAIQESLEKDRKKRQARTEQETVRERLVTLSPREYEVMTFVIAGLLNKQIGYELEIAEETVKIHRGRLVRKMCVESVAELVHLTEIAGVRPATPQRP